MDNDYIIEKTIILFFSKKPDIESYGWINKNHIKQYQNIWVVYGRYFYRKNMDGIWIYEFISNKNMFNLCKKCLTKNDKDNISQYYLRYRCLHFIVYGPLNLKNISTLDQNCNIFKKF
jgi:hypothetical protein